MHWQQLVIILPQELAETLETWLADYALSVSMSDAGHEPLFQEEPTEMPLWKTVQIEALFDGDDPQVPDLVMQIKANYPQLQHCTVNTLIEEDWVRLTQSQFPSQCFNNQLWIFPSWEKVPDSLTHVVRIDPGLAFGTGTHATTKLCLEWLSKQSLVEKTGIDFGCGSGILALSALALGASKMWAFDHDSQALQATQNNAQLNSWLDSQQLIITADLGLLPTIPVNIVLANILAKPLCELATLLTQLTCSHGYLVLSGLLKSEVGRVLQHYKDDFTLIAQCEKEGWKCLVLNKIY